MKRTIYLIAFAVLGLLFSTIFHAVFEYLLLTNGVSWSAWTVYHYWFTILVAVLGIVGGWRLGLIGWRIVYIEKRHHGWFKK
ncbi:MAG: hypothetical protein V1838_05595 [Patescibacteria group bacterium]